MAFRIAKGGEYTETGTDKDGQTTFKYVTTDGKTHVGNVYKSTKIPTFDATDKDGINEKYVPIDADYTKLWLESDADKEADQ